MTRLHGTRACYVFGVDPGGDRSKGCRCEPCREANRVYARSRDRAARRPDEELRGAYVDAGEAIDHLVWLRSQGVGLRTVAAKTGLSRSALHELVTKRRTRATRDTVTRILSVGRHVVHGNALVDAVATWKLIDDLLRHGYTRTALARELGSTAKVPSLQIGHSKVTAMTAGKVEEIHRRLMVRVLAERERAAARRRIYREREAAA